MDQILIQIPEGHVIDTEQSNLEEGKIVFKKKEVTPWRYKRAKMNGYFINSSSIIGSVSNIFNVKNARHIFATEKQAKSMLAMAQMSQIIQNDKRFGGPITDEEWEDEDMPKYVIVRSSKEIRRDYFMKHYHFLAFHTKEQRDLFLKENEDLIRQYFMLD